MVIKLEQVNCAGVRIGSGGTIRRGSSFSIQYSSVSEAVKSASFQSLNEVKQNLGKLNEKNTLIFFIRHGETDFNKEGRIQAVNSDIEINSIGEEQAIKTAKNLKQIPLHQLYSSPLKRALDTAVLTAKERGLSWFQKREELEEIKMGSLGGLCIIENRKSGLIEAQEKFPEEFGKFMNSPSEFQAPNGEHIEQARTRGWKALAQIVRENHGKIIGVVTHGWLSKLIFLETFKIPTEKFWEEGITANSSITVIEYSSDLKANKLWLWNAKPV